MAQEEDTEFMKLPIDERCVHKLWKARVNGYEEAAKQFRTFDEKSPEWNKYLGILKKFVIDSHAMAQEKGLEATLIFVENCAVAGKTVGEVMGGIVTKCLGAPKAKTKELGMQIGLMYVEIEKHEQAIEELIKGFDQKNPKIVATCITTIIQALREFGAKVVPIKPLVKRIPALLSDRDKAVREEAKQLTVEIYRWIGPVFKTQIQSLPQVVLTELEAEFEKAKNDKAIPSRFLRSQQEKQAVAAATVNESAEDEADEEETDAGIEIDPMDLIDPVDILSQLPKNFYEKLEEKKWQERKESLDALETLLQNPKLQTGDYGELVRALKKVITKDTNVVLVALAGKCLALLAKGLSMKFQPYAVVCIGGILEKFKEKKQNVVTALREAIDAIYPSTNLEAIQDDIFAGLANKNPAVKAETAMFLARMLPKTVPTILNKKLLKAYVTALLKTLNESDPTVRDASADALGTAMKLVGEKNILPFLADVEALKMEKIKEYCEKAVITVKIPGVKKEARVQSAPVKSAPKGGSMEPKAVTRPASGVAPKKVLVKKPSASGSSSALAKSASSKKSAGTKTPDKYDDDEDEDEPPQSENINDNLPRVDISPMITESLIAEINDKNWKTRNEGLIKFQNILNEHKLLKPSLGELPPHLAARLGDSNAKIAQTAVDICQQLATSMGPGCKQHIRVLFPGILRGLGDNKAYLRTACITCINTWGDQCGYKEFFDGEMFADALKKGTPSLKSEVWAWMADKLPNMPPKSVNKEELIACLSHLYDNICDRNADVRKNANECVLGMMMHLGYDAMMKAVERQKPASKKDIQAALDKARPNLPVKPLPKSKQQAPIAAEEKKVVKSGSSKMIKPPVSKPGSGTAASRKKEEDVDLSPLFHSSNLKHQRLLDEQKLKVLKWNFTTPREEFNDLLKEQMITANVNKSLMANMFHDDFRYHLKVIDSLLDDLSENLQGLICNLDLVLKWLSLRFYDTNPSVLLKGLEYLNLVFQNLVDNSYTLTDIEGTSFIPHLLTKIGDPKDTVRNGVRQLLRQICLVYPFSKVFAYVMDALKSKNARQRTECLDELGYLIETYNLTVCQPTPQHALKEIARQISDRDNSVRSAALNCIVKAHELAGERIYKMIGQLSEKDLSMLDERIKRSKKNPKPVVEVRQPTVSSVEIVNVPVDRDDDSRELSGEDELPSEEDVDPNIRAYEPTQKRAPSGPFKLDPEIIADIEKGWIRADQIQQTQLRPIDFTYIEEPLKSKICNGVTFPHDRLEQLLAKCPTRPQSANVSLYSASSPQRHHFSPPSRPNTAPAPELSHLMEAPKLDAKLLNMIKGIGHPDRLVSHASLNELCDILESPDKQAVLRDYDEIYINAVLEQFKHLSQRPVTEAVTLYQPLLSSLFNFFNSKSLGQNLSLVTIKNLIAVLLGLMSDHKFGGEEYTKVINSICLKILDRCNFTHLNCALVRLLRETCSGSALPKFTELLMKCIWRNVKLMPERVNELDYEAVLMEIHDFMLALPTQWWANRPSDTPMRTIKTIIHNMTKIKGTGVLQHLNNIPKHSELNTYVLRILKKEQPVASGNDSNQQAYASQLHQQRSQQDRMNRTTHDQVSNIFKLISEKETSKLGLKQLYEFKAKHPEVDIQPFLRGASPFFQTFINDGLADLEKASQNSTNNNQSEEPSAGTQRNQADGNNPDYWMQKLNMYRVRGKLQSEETDPMDNKIADENLNLNQIQSRLSTITKKDVEHLPPGRLSLLQQKLNQYKQV